MSEDSDDDTGEDPFCSRCGQALPDAFDQQINEAVTRNRRSLTLLAAVKAREHFALVGRLRGQLSLTHPRVRQVSGAELQPGWLIRNEQHMSAFGPTTIWNVIVSIEDDRVNILGTDPSHGNIGGSIGRSGQHWIDDLEIEERHPYEPWRSYQEPT